MVSNALLESQMVDIKNLPKLLIPVFGGVKILQYPHCFKPTQALLNEDGTKFTRVNF